jgi:hypothetical protein
VLAVAPAAATARADVASRVPTARHADVAAIVSPVPFRVRLDGATVGVLSPLTAWGHGEQRLLVVGAATRADGSRWLQVLLGSRGAGAAVNDHRAWVPAARVEVRRTTWRVEVSLADRRLVVLRDGRLQRSTRVVVGAPSTPTPTGRFAIYERARQPDPRAFLGPWALHLTAHSEVLDDYGGGPGRVAIHGRDGASLADPLGSARSHGCVRIPDPVVSWMARVLPVGTPVVVRRR